MKALALGLLLILGQYDAVVDRPVVHLDPRHDFLTADDGGKLVELIRSPLVIHLPATPPERSTDGHMWTVDVKNLGPQTVKVVDGRSFSVTVAVNQTVHIHSTGHVYGLN